MKTALAILALSALTTLAPFDLLAVATGSVSLTDLDNDLAVVDGEGNLSITSSSTTFYNGNVAAHMFDGDVSTYADLNKNEGWIGIQLKTPMLVTDVRYKGRINNNGQAKRVVGCFIQGANSADYSDAVTLHVCKPPADWDPSKGEWLEARVDAAAANQTFIYLRIYSSGVGGAIHAGNLAELEFYGQSAPEDAAAPEAPVMSNVAWINGGAGFDLTVSDGTIAYTVAKTTESGVGDASLYYNFYTSSDSPIRAVLPRTSLELPTIAVTAGNMAGTSPATTLSVTAQPYPLTGTASGAATAANAFDGDETTICSLAANEAVVLDLGAVRAVSGVKLLVVENASNLVGARVEVSQDADFFDVQTLATVSVAPAIGEVVVLNVASSLAGRYVRLITPKACSLAEVEFNDAMAAVEPTAFSVARDGLENQYAVLSWTMPENASIVTVYRAPGAGGPWTALATVTNDTTYTDETGPVGITMYYKLAPVVDGVAGALCDATVSHRRCRLLERDWSDMTTLKSGVSLIYTPTTAKYYNGGSIAGSLAFWFDNSTTTFGNTAVKAAGLDLGEACSVGFVRIYPRSGSQGEARFPGMTCWGSNDGDNWNTTGTQLAGPATDNTVNWKEWASMDTTPYHYVYFTNPSNSSWNAQTAEIQFYGWSTSEVATAAIGATDVTAVQDGSSVALTWECDAQVGTFRVERSADGGAWTALADGLTTKTYVDAAVALDGTTYSYRVVTVNGNDEAISAASASVRPYAHGGGTGLHAIYCTNYTASAANEVVALVTTNAQINVTGGSLVPGIDDATNNVLVRYTGKLIVPFAGQYRFRAQADDAVAVILDGNFVLSQPVLETGVVLSPLVSLTAGEHDIDVRYCQYVGAASCILSWCGPVQAEVIPQAQFVPEPPSALPEPWEGGRPFSGNDAANFFGDVRANADGSYDLAFSGSDLYKGDNGYTFMWRPVSGDFTIRATMTFIGPANINGQKGGLMVRSALGARSPFESIVMRNNSGGGFACCHCTSEGGSITQPANINGGSAWSVAGSTKNLRLKITRRGNVFESSFRKSGDSSWTTLYRYEDKNGNYGDTVYVGPASSFITPGSFARDMDSNFTSSFAKPRYSWRFSEIDIRPVVGLSIIVK